MALILSSSVFWVPVIISFYQARGFPLNEVYLTITFFSLSIVLMEYPTGVIGDYFSHKLSVQMGFFITSLFSFLSLIYFPKYVYYILLFMVGIGSSLSSGSDIALLHKNSTNFKKDLADVKYGKILALLTGTALGGYFGTINIDIPIFLTALTTLISGIILLFVADVTTVKTKPSEGANIFDHAKEGIYYFKSNAEIRRLMLIGIFMGTLILSIKWFFNTLFIELDIKENLWGIISSLSFAFTALGALVSKKLDFGNIKILIIVTLLSFSLIGINGYASLIFLTLYSLFHGFYEVNMDNNINKLIPDKIRASILSLQSLQTRILYALYTFLAGITLTTISSLEFIRYSGILTIFILLPFILKIDSKNSTS